MSIMNNKDAVGNDDDFEMEDENSKSRKRQVYIPGKQSMEEGEELTFDKSAYDMFEKFQTEYPCLTVDSVMHNNTFDTYPLTCYLVTGTQAQNVRDNSLHLIKLSNLHKLKKKTDGESDSESSESEVDDDESVTVNKQPIMHTAKIAHHGGVNRIRSAELCSSSVCAVWNDQQKVQLWNLNSCIQAVDAMEGKCAPKNMNKEKPLFSFAGHQCEGFALDWCPTKLGWLSTGDNRGRIHVWQMGEGGTWVVDQKPLTGHNGSVEDLQWSPNEDGVLCSCSSDGCLKLWDVRVSPSQACVCTVPKAHSSDVNVLSWNKTEPLLLSGGDDGALKIWDLKLIQYGEPVASFKHHTGPISSVEWYHNESTVFAASGEDDQTTVWDLSLETEEGRDTEQEVPPQLLFIHMGQKEVKEVRWPKSLKGVLITTSLDGFDIFKTISV